MNHHLYPLLVAGKRKLQGNELSFSVLWLNLLLQYIWFNLGKHVGPRLGTAKYQAWSGSRLSDILIIFLGKKMEKFFYKSADNKKKYAKSLKSFYTFQKTDNKTADQTVQMSRLVCAFVALFAKDKIRICCSEANIFGVFLFGIGNFDLICKYISSVGSQKLVSLILKFFRRDKKTE